MSYLVPDYEGAACLAGFLRTGLAEQFFLVFECLAACKTLLTHLDNLHMFTPAYPLKRTVYPVWFLRI